MRSDLDFLCSIEFSLLLLVEKVEGFEGNMEIKKSVAIVWLSILTPDCEWA